MIKKNINLLMSNKKKVIVVIVILIVIITIVLSLINGISGEKKLKNEELGVLNNPLVFVEGDQLLYVDVDTLEKTILEEDYDKEIQGNLQIAFSSENPNLIAYTSGSNLFIYDLNSNEKEKIATNMSTEYTKDNKFNFISDDKYIIFQDVDNNFFVHIVDKNVRYKIYEIDYDQSIDIISSYGDKIVFTVYDDAEDDYYTYDPYRGEKEAYIFTIGEDSQYDKIGENIDMISVDAHNYKIFYSIVSGESNKSSYYLYDIKDKNADKVIVDADELLYVNSDYSSFIYSKYSESTYNIIEDDMNGLDYIIQYVDETCEYYDYRYGRCTLEQYENEQSFSREYKVDVSSKIELVNNYNNKKLKNIYSYNVETKKEELVLENIVEFKGTSFHDNTFMYSVYDNKIKMSDAVNNIENYYELDSYFNKHQSHKYFINNEIKNITIPENIGFSYASIMNDYDIYFYTDDSALYYIDSESLTAKNVANDIDANTTNGDTFIYYTSSDYNDDLVYDAIVLEDDKIIKEFNDVMYSTSWDNDSYYYHSCKWNSCKVSSYEDSDNILYEDVYNVQIIDSETEIILKNYSDTNGTVDIYKSSNGELEKIAIDIPMYFLSIEINGFFTSNIGI